MGRKQRKNVKFKERMMSLKKRGLTFFMENAKIPCQVCREITDVHAYGRSKEVIRYACWNERCSERGVEKSMFNCHQEIRRYLGGA